MVDLPDPPVPGDVDLRDFQFMPLDVLRLRDSDIAGLASGEEFKAAVLLWCVAWHQVPAGSLPDDDRLLARYSGAGPAWRKVRDMALRGFEKCADGRLYHPVICEKAMEAWGKRRLASAKGKAGARARWSRDDDPANGNGHAPANADAIAQASSNDGTSNGTGNAPAIAQAMPAPMPKNGKGQGQGHINPPLFPPTPDDRQPRKPRATPPPDRFEVTPDLWDWALGVGLPEDRIESETAQFLEHHHAKGSRFIDWVAAWRTWIRNAVKFTAQRRA